MKTLRRFWSLSGYSRIVVLEAAIALAAGWIGLRFAGLRRWQKLLAGLAPGTSDPASATDPVRLESARAIARLELAAARHLFFNTNCLEQSLALWWLLRRRGIAAELRIGARKHEGRFEAHAWVESGGRVVSEAGAEELNFVPFDASMVTMETQTH